MLEIKKITVKPINMARMKSEKSTTGEFIKITFLHELPNDAKGNFYGKKKLEVIEIFEEYTEETFGAFNDLTISSVVLLGIYANYKFRLMGFEDIKKD